MLRITTIMILLCTNAYADGDNGAIAAAQQAASAMHDAVAGDDDD